MRAKYQLTQFLECKGEGAHPPAPKEAAVTSWKDVIYSYEVVILLK